MSRNGRRRRARLAIARMIARVERLEKLGQAAKRSLRQRLWESLGVFLGGLAGARPGSDLSLDDHLIVSRLGLLSLRLRGCLTGLARERYGADRR